MATRGDFVAALRAEMEEAIRLLQVENIAPVDLAQSAIGPGIAIFSRYARVVEADGKPMTVRAALALINEVLAEVLSGEESEFDADTRFALTWFEQYGHNPGPFGDADLLARAKDTTVAGVAQAGAVASRDGKVRLVERSELPNTWDPATDTRLTVWETAQYLIRELDSSETDAARLLARLGPGMSERARQLAYLLYGICDKKKWADEAGAYNMLVTAWPEIARLAAGGLSASETERLF
jgi:putative DNA methylase